MLLLYRKINESVIITVGDTQIEVSLVETRRDAAKLGFVAPDYVTIDRKEIHERKQEGAS